MLFEKPPHGIKIFIFFLATPLSQHRNVIASYLDFTECVNVTSKVAQPTGSKK